MRSKPFKNLQNTSNGTQTGRDAHVRFSDRFLQTAQISLKRCRFPYISLKRLKLLMNVPYFLKTLMISLKRLKNTPALRARGLHTRSSWSSVIRKRNETKTFELMAFLKKRSQLSKMKTTEKMQNFQKWNLSALVATKSFTLDGDKVCHVFVTFSWR